MKTITNITRVLSLGLLAVTAAACTPKVGITQGTTTPSTGKPVMVVPTDAIPGESGDRVELAAWGFTEAKSTRVWFGETLVTDVKVVDGWRVQVAVPPGQGTVDVCIENAAGAWVLLEAFQYAEGTGVEHCWPSSVILSKVDRAKQRIADVRRQNSGTRLASVTPVE